MRERHPLLYGLLTALLLPVAILAQQPATPIARFAPASAVQAPVTTPEFEGFDQWVTSVMKEWKVPGLAIAAIQDGEVVLSKGFGYRNVADQLPVTPRTLMAIGSNSKSFTVTLMGILSDEGKLDWDEAVRTYLPDFELYDDVATRLMTPTDLVDHRSGLPRHDTMWYGRSFTRPELYQRLRFLEPSATFRQRYQYNNLMFMTAGYLLEQLTGQSWDDLVKQRIFTPLGMTRSNTSVRDMPRSDDYALPYMERDDEIVAVPFRNLDAIAPAGAINSSVEDMMRYIEMHINQGTYLGKPIISKAMSIRMQSPQSATPANLEPEEPVYPEIGPGAYGLGLSVGSYRGHRLVAHGGGIDGFISSMSWMPEDQLGVMVLTNFSGNNPVPSIVMRNVYDRLLGLEAVDWVARVKAAQARADKRRAEREQKQEAERVAGTSPSHPLTDYTGTYEHPAYGIVTVSQRDGQLVFTLDQFVTPLEHFHYDVFRGAKQEPGSPNRFEDTRVTFAYGSNGKVESVAIRLEPNVSEIVFTRTERTE